MRLARFQSVLLYLALAATLLMALAPVLSRWLQAAPAPGVALLVHEAAHADHTAHTGGHAGEPRGAAGHGLPAGPHAAHGEACDYCTMASRLLPWLAALLVLAPLLHRPAPASPWAVAVPASLRWPAHPVRGPPLFS
ncbi:DUF2946 family protein [Stenotrophomonas mori]|uniref:DUF2946 family protein n=1 Tax=Stenotrophomonas mori TaxID=2871096 RepID=A0ABT0SCU5_9GAMM|nr:DUF2946 family protein [Stenotrophomonas mori]MCL7713145.1 DUF2946 family protein [Stenotrophomonas mori]